MNHFITKYLNRKGVAILVFAVAITAGGCLNKNYLPSPRAGDLMGAVSDAVTGEPVPGVQITIIDQNITVYTDENGTFDIVDLSPGDYSLSLQRDWYVTRTVTWHYVGKSDTVEWQLERSPWPGNGGLLYCNYTSGVKREIYCFNLIKQTVCQVTESNGFAKNNPAQFSATEVVYETEGPSGNDDLMIMDGRTRQTRPFCISPQNDQHPSAAVFQAKLTFQSTRDQGRRKIFYNPSITGEAPEALCDGQNPVISPDGNKIALVNGSYKLCIYDIPTRTVTAINHPGKINNPSWSPDGTEIAVELWEVTDGPRYIYVITPGTGGIQQITYGYRSNSQHRHPGWSGDGSLLFFSGNIAYSSREDIYCIRRADGVIWREKAVWLMVSGGTGDKTCPCWIDGGLVNAIGTGTGNRGLPTATH